MALSQVEIASSSPFGCVLRDHNRRDQWNSESNARATQAAFQKNIKELVQTNLHSCISGPPRNSDSGSDENSHHQINNTDLWVHNAQGNNNHQNIHLSNTSNNANNNKNQKQSKLVDRWARAREMVFTVDRRGQDGVSSTFQRENSPAQSDSSVETPNLGGVSSLVRRWKDFEAESKSLNSNNSFVCSTSNSGSTFMENASYVDAPPTGSDARESFDERYETVTTNDDSFADWESDRAVMSSPPSSQGRYSDAAEKERVRVADIIRKLISANQMQQGSLISCGEDQNVVTESLPQVRTSSDQPEQRCFSQIISSPRIRGRQALSDLLMRMERDRHRELEGLVERKAVSRFPQRGRIQALLRVRFFRRGAEVSERQYSNLRASELNRLTQGSSIMHLRERFNTGIKHFVADSQSSPREAMHDSPDVGNSSITSQLREEIHHQIATDSRNPCGKVTNNTPDVQNSSTSHTLRKDIHHQEVNTPVPQSTLRVQNSEDLYKHAAPRSDITWQEASSEFSILAAQESAETATSMNGGEENRNAEEQEANNQQPLGTSHEWIRDICHPQSDWEELVVDDQHLIGSSCGWTSDASQPQSEWDEQQYDNEQLVETNDDWIHDISRPRSDWEGLRQERYQQMLDPFMENGDIRQLLERRSVSAFLSSGLRERIDRLMMSRSQRELHPIGHQAQEEEDGEEDEQEEGNGGIEDEESDEVDESPIGRQYNEVEEEEENADNSDDGDEESDEDESPNVRQYNEVGHFVDQTPSSLHPIVTSLFRSRSHNLDYDVSDDSDQVASPSLQQSLSSNSYTQDNRQCSSFMNTPSIEMELIYNLRGHMEQLHHEMSELRRSIKSCMNMQVKLQRSIKQEVAAAATHSARRVSKNSLNRDPKKGICCVCYEVQVDSFLYRCGHMCTCFKCAHDLQWSSGKCPICRAPIDDVVQAYN